MAEIQDIINDPWGPHTHTEVENALKGKLSELEESVGVDEQARAELGNKVDKVFGKGLSTNDYTDAEKSKLANIEDDAEKNVINRIQTHDGTELTPTEGVVTLPEVQIEPGTDGKSAYDIACENDFVGTEAEWLESLKGADGLSGNYDIAVVHNTEGTPSGVDDDVAVLGANVGKLLQEQIDAIDSEGGIQVYVGGPSDDTLFIITDQTLPQLQASLSALSFGQVQIGGSGRILSVNVMGKNITGNITLALTGTNASLFSLSKSSIAGTTARFSDTVNVTFNPTSETSEGSKSATLVITYGDKVINVALSGTAVEEVVPMITVDADTITLKGVTNNTAAADYSDEPAKQTLHIQAQNIDQDLSLSIDSNKFKVLRNSQEISSIPLADALSGVDVVVMYVKQSAATQTADTATLTISGSLDGIAVNKTVSVSGETGAKVTSGTIASKNGLLYSYDGQDVLVKIDPNNVPTFTGQLVLDVFIDDYGYKYPINGCNQNSFNERVNSDYANAVAGITSLELGSEFAKIYGYAFRGCHNMRTVTANNITETRAGIFQECDALGVLDIYSMDFSWDDMFKSCTALSTVIIRKTDGVATFSSSKTPFDKGAVAGITGDVIIYVENGVNKQKKLYVPSEVKSSYEAHAMWSLFEIHSIDELTQ